MTQDEKSPFVRWTAFLQKTESSNTPTLNRFAARYQLSVKFKGIDAKLSAKTLDGYSKIFHVFLAYSAFETLLKGIEELSKREVDPMSVELDIDIDKHNYPMIDDQIADSLRKIKGLSEVLLEYADKDIRIVRLKAFFSLPLNQKELDKPKFLKLQKELTLPNNLLVIASSIRNVVAHGQLSAYGAKAVSVKNGRTLEQLAKLVEKCSLEIFSSYVDLLDIKYGHMRYESNSTADLMLFGDTSQ
jgi:hypothetical protein